MPRSYLTTISPRLWLRYLCCHHQLSCSMNFDSSRITKWPDPPFERRRWLSFDCGRLAYYAMSRCHRIIINPARGCYVVILKRCTDSRRSDNATTASAAAAGAMASLGWPMVLVVVRRRGVSTAATSGDKPSLRLDRRVYIMALYLTHSLHCVV
jgi:hypothetical protein